MSRDGRALRLIDAYTELRCPAVVPEIKLHLARDMLAFWQQTEVELYARAAGSGDTPPPYWAFAWPGGQALARYILDRRSEFSGKCVLDFGSGSGLVAIAAALAGAAPVIATEIDAGALTAMEINAAANGVYIEQIEYDIIGGSGRWHIVCAGDICYERPLAERAIAWLKQLAADGTEVLIGDPGRSYLPASGMVTLATYDIPTSREIEDRESRETSVYRLLP